MPSFFLIAQPFFPIGESVELPASYFWFCVSPGRDERTVRCGELPGGSALFCAPAARICSHEFRLCRHFCATFFTCSLLSLHRSEAFLFAFLLFSPLAAMGGALSTHPAEDAPPQVSGPASRLGAEEFGCGAAGCGAGLRRGIFPGNIRGMGRDKRRRIPDGYRASSPGWHLHSLES